MEAHTQREFEAWIAYLDLQAEKPDLLTWYLILIATEVRRSYVKKARSVKMKHLQLRFQDKVSDPKKAVENSKAAWAALLARPGARPGGRKKRAGAPSEWSEFLSGRLQPRETTAKPVEKKSDRYRPRGRTMWTGL
jgi:hypothetical protein